ncbi:hypothetical protein IGI04_006368, partial [Brassica rapa subsp. trilocularis]
CLFHSWTIHIGCHVTNSSLDVATRVLDVKLTCLGRCRGVAREVEFFSNPNNAETMNRCLYLLIVRRRHGDVCASSHHLSISNQTFRSTGKTPTETFLNDVGLELGRAELRFWLIDLLLDASDGGGREVDSILQVVRFFEDNDIYHVGGKVNPTSDLDFINLELIFCDLDQLIYFTFLQEIQICKILRTYEMQDKRIHNLKSKKTIV